jgi:hypothetical protein
MANERPMTAEDSWVHDVHVRLSDSCIHLLPEVDALHVGATVGDCPINNLPLQVDGLMHRRQLRDTVAINDATCGVNVSAPLISSLLAGFRQPGSLGSYFICLRI